MKKPSLEEVREHFKDAEKVNGCIYDNVCFSLKDITYNDNHKAWYSGEDVAPVVTLWCNINGYSKITKYKNDKPKQYKKGIDTMCRAESNMTLNERLGAVKWNIDKYNWRDKGQDREDFIKIKAYCDYAIKQLDNERKQ